jgi:hypothetical protein
LVRRQTELADAQRGLEATIAARLDTERTRIATEEAERARQHLQADLKARDAAVADLQALLQSRDEKLAEAQAAQAEVLRKSRELDDAKRELALTVEKEVGAKLDDVRDRARREAEGDLGLKVRERDEQIAGMQRQIEDLRRRAEQGSQQLQGEVQEQELEAVLRARFPRDLFEPVGKGEFGGDLIQRIIGPGEQVCGTILWEAKRTKNWSDGWLPKLREDKRVAKADLALIISHALPKGLDGFDLLEGVWVAEPRCAVPVAVALRESMIALAGARAASEGQQTKMELVYRYLTGPRFRHRIEAMLERFDEMQTDLDRERKAMTRLWAKREEQIAGMLGAAAGLYGDLQGIAGRSLGEIEGLTLPLLGGPDEVAPHASLQ